MKFEVNDIIVHKNAKQDRYRIITKVYDEGDRFYDMTTLGGFPMSNMSGEYIESNYELSKKSIWDKEIKELLNEGII